MFEKIDKKSLSDKFTYKKYNLYGFRKTIVLLEEKVYNNIQRIIKLIGRYI